MTPEEYLQQAYRLDQRIRLDTEEVKRIRELSCSVSAISMTRNTCRLPIHRMQLSCRHWNGWKN